MAAPAARKKLEVTYYLWPDQSDFYTALLFEILPGEIPQTASISATRRKSLRGALCRSLVRAVLPLENSHLQVFRLKSRFPLGSHRPPPPPILLAYPDLETVGLLPFTGSARKVMGAYSKTAKRARHLVLVPPRTRRRPGLFRTLSFLIDKAPQTPTCSPLKNRGPVTRWPWPIFSRP